ncbi:MAG: hypothetical protein NTY38_21905, partial [Acidobacteria bacterium]|nr:hypothetical protein [Acidobacteriota bacterium]
QLILNANRVTKCELYGHSHIGDPLRRARLVVVYDMFSPAYKRLRPAIEAWVLRGGKLIFWDPLSRATEDPLLTGIRFWANSTYKPATKAAFADSPDPLLRGLSGVTVTVDPLARLCPSIHEASAEWHELAYTVLSNAAYLSLYDRLEPFGPTWVSMMGTARVPLVLARKHGAGSVVLAQLGVWAVRPPRETTSDAAQLAPSHLRRLTENIISWTRD